MNKVFFGNSILIIWFLFGLWAGTELVVQYGERMFSAYFSLPAYLIVWVLVIFLGRFYIEKVINKLWKTDGDNSQTKGDS